MGWLFIHQWGGLEGNQATLSQAENFDVVASCNERECGMGCNHLLVGLKFLVSRVLVHIYLKIPPLLLLFLILSFSVRKHLFLSFQLENMK